jgi:hypothetical protein
MRACARAYLIHTRAHACVLAYLIHTNKQIFAIQELRSRADEDFNAKSKVFDDKIQVKEEEVAQAQARWACTYSHYMRAHAYMYVCVCVFTANAHKYCIIHKHMQDKSAAIITE